MTEQKAVPEIPEDLRRLYELGQQGRAWVRTADDVATDDGCRVGPHPSPCELIERIAALTAERDALKTKNEQMDALMELACADVIFFHSQEHGPFLTSDEQVKTIAFSILVNDLFYPAADAEGFDISEAIPLRDVFRKEGMEGIIRWVQQKRDNLPLRPHVEEHVKEQEGLRKEVPALKAKVVEWTETASAYFKELHALTAENARLSDALRQIISDFESDYVLDGVVVDEPANTHRIAWILARSALAARASTPPEPPPGSAKHTVTIRQLGPKEVWEKLRKLQRDLAAGCTETCHSDCTHSEMDFYLHCAEVWLETAVTPEHPLHYRCPFGGETTGFHDQPQLDMIQKELDRRVADIRYAVRHIRSGVVLMVPEPLKMGFLEIIDGIGALGMAQPPAGGG